jgi:hypothetical protein
MFHPLYFGNRLQRLTMIQALDPAARSTVEGVVKRSFLQRISEPPLDMALAPDVLRRHRLTGRFTLLNLVANIAFFLNDLLVIGDPLMIGIDLVAVPFFTWLHIRYVLRGDQRSTAVILLIALNVWLFFNASYYGERGLIFLFLYTLILMTFFLIDFRERIKLGFFMIFPVVSIVVREITSYTWFANPALTPLMVEQTRLLSMGMNLLLLFTFMDGILRCWTYTCPAPTVWRWAAP